MYPTRLPKLFLVHVGQASSLRLPHDVGALEEISPLISVEHQHAARERSEHNPLGPPSRPRGASMSPRCRSPNREASRQDFAMTTISARYPILAGEHLAGAGESPTGFIDDEDESWLYADLRSGPAELERHDLKPPSPLTGSMMMAAPFSGRYPPLKISQFFSPPRRLPLSSGSGNGTCSVRHGTARSRSCRARTCPSAHTHPFGQMPREGDICPLGRRGRSSRVLDGSHVREEMVSCRIARVTVQPLWPMPIRVLVGRGQYLQTA